MTDNYNYVLFFFNVVPIDFNFVSILCIGMKYDNFPVIKQKERVSK